MKIKPMTVADLIEYLKKQDQSLPVAYALHSEYCLLESSDMKVKKLHKYRPDGWVHCFYKESEIKEKGMNYFVLPGN